MFSKEKIQELHGLVEKYIGENTFDAILLDVDGELFDKDGNRVDNACSLEPNHVKVVKYKGSNKIGRVPYGKR